MLLLSDFFDDRCRRLGRLQAILYFLLLKCFSFLQSYNWFLSWLFPAAFWWFWIDSTLKLVGGVGGGRGLLPLNLALLYTGCFYLNLFTWFVQCLIKLTDSDLGFLSTLTCWRDHSMLRLLLLFIHCIRSCRRQQSPVIILKLLCRWCTLGRCLTVLWVHEGGHGAAV